MKFTWICPQADDNLFRDCLLLRIAAAVYAVVFICLCKMLSCRYLEIEVIVNA